MGVRTYLRSPVALGWTLLGIAGVGTAVVAGWRLAVVLASSTAIADPALLGDLGVVVPAGVVAGTVLAASAAVWLPCSAAIADAVGRRRRGRPASFAGTLDVVRARSEPLYRWAKVNVAIGPIADRVLTENDVAAVEVAAGCGGFVVPAIVLDAPTLPSAVERANRVVPRPGRRRVQLAGSVGTGAIAAAAGGIGTVAGSVLPAGVALPPASMLVVAALVVGLVVTAALDVAWRAGVYAAAPDDGFSG